MIRREFRLAEGDAFNADAAAPHPPAAARSRLLQQRRRSQPQPGSAPDKAIVNTTVDEKATGDCPFGGGYSTDAGALVDAGLRERNLIGTGIDAGINGVLAQRQQLRSTCRSPIRISSTATWSPAPTCSYVQTNNLTDRAVPARGASASRCGWATISTTICARPGPTRWSDRTVYNVAVRRQLLHAERGRLHAAVADRPDADARLSRQPRRSAQRLRPARRHRLSPAWAATRISSAPRCDGALLRPARTVHRQPRLGHLALGAAPATCSIWASRSRSSTASSSAATICAASRSAAPVRTPTTNVRAATASAGASSGRIDRTAFPAADLADLGLTGRAFVDVGAPDRRSTESICTACGALRRFRDAARRRRRRRLLEDAVRPDQHRLADPVVKEKYDQTQVFRFGFGTRF